MDDESSLALQQLSYQLLKPIEESFGEIDITYGFTSFELLKYIKKYSPGDMAPELDQHAAFELNSRGTRICKRDGAACDIYVEGYKEKMHLIAQYVITELPFDRLYYYGKDRPIHITFGPDHSRYLHVKERDRYGKRNLGKGAKGDKAIELLNISI
uniref:Peptidase M15A C-terminal domain-containing protein n=1 Tax=Vibrio algicola TaxID=2662262 RepID=A0A5Q0TGP0_9VIBR